MTRKDYIKIAEVLRKINEEWQTYHMDIETIINAFCDMLEADNRSFDRDKFIKYITK